MQRVLILDDDPSAARLLESLTAAAPFEKTVAVFFDWPSLRAECERTPPDIVLCDIVLRDKNGVCAMQALQRDFPSVKVIFISGYARDYFESVYQVRHEHLLSKPVKPDLLRDALCRAAEAARRERAELVWVRSNRQMRGVRPRDVSYCEISGKNRLVHLPKGPLETTQSLDELAELLGGSFARCHYSILVNIERVTALNKDHIELDDGGKLPVSERFRAAFKEKLLKHHEVI